MKMQVATASDCPNAAALFYSLVNTVFGFDPVGWVLPLGLTSTSISQRYLDGCIQVLAVLLDYGPPEYAEPLMSGDGEGIKGLIPLVIAAPRSHPDLCGFWQKCQKMLPIDHATTINSCSPPFKLLGN